MRSTRFVTLVTIDNREPQFSNRSDRTREDAVEDISCHLPKLAAHIRSWCATATRETAGRCNPGGLRHGPGWIDHGEDRPSLAAAEHTNRYSSPSRLERLPKFVSSTLRHGVLVRCDVGQDPSAIDEMFGWVPLLFPTFAAFYRIVRENCMQIALSKRTGFFDNHPTRL